MLKYVDARVVFQEIPDEITLAINISKLSLIPIHTSIKWTFFKKEIFNLYIEIKAADPEKIAPTNVHRIA